MILDLEDHWARELGLSTLHMTKLGPKKIHKMGPD